MHGKQRWAAAAGLAVCVAIAAGRAAAAPVAVRVEGGADGWRLLRDGQPYVIKGGGGRDHLDALAAAGGNSLRTWDPEGARPLLDRAQALGLTVTVGFWLGHPRHGFKYGDAAAVGAQRDGILKALAGLKDHPAVLLWGIGNEMEGDGKDPAVWQAVNDLARAAKALDPAHPVLTVVAEISAEKVAAFNAHCPDVDILGINSYGGATTLARRYRDAGGRKPFIVSEFGPVGQWECAKTAWAAPLEVSSTAKARTYREAYRATVEAQPAWCLGAYAFIWGHKQEATATWFGMFLRDGTRLAAVEAMTEAWGGQPPANRCPVVSEITLDRREGLRGGDRVRASWQATDPDGDALTVQWVLRREAAVHSTGGDAQAEEPDFPGSVVSSGVERAELLMPSGGGGYRLFAYARDGKGNGAVANAPLHAEGPALPPPASRATVPFVVYDEAGGPQPFTPSGYMGNTGAIALDPACTNGPSTGATCLEVRYRAGDNWGGVVWQSPANDWGDQPGGYDLSAANALTFRVRGTTGQELVTFGVGVIGADKPFPDTGRAELKALHLTTDWRRYTVPLAGQDLGRIKSGFFWSLSGQGAPLTFYLDDIRFIADPALPPAWRAP